MPAVWQWRLFLLNPTISVDLGYQHPIAYESHKVTAAERNYPAHMSTLSASFDIIS